MSIYSAKHRIVTATILAAGLQCGLVVPSVAAEAPVTTHSAVQKTATLNATPNQAEDNQQVQGAASMITMKAQLKDGGYLLRWTGFPEGLEASSVLVDVNFYTPSGEYGGSVLESPTLSEGAKEGEFPPPDEPCNGLERRVRDRSGGYRARCLLRILCDRAGQPPGPDR